jgi:hypothetical protein
MEHITEEKVSQKIVEKLLLYLTRASSPCFAAPAGFSAPEDGGFAIKYISLLTSEL